MEYGKYNCFKSYNCHRYNIFSSPFYFIKHIISDYTCVRGYNNHPSDLKHLYTKPNLMDIFHLETSCHCHQISFHQNLRNLFFSDLYVCILYVCSLMYVALLKYNSLTDNSFGQFVINLFY